VWGGWARVFLRSKPGRRSEGQWEGEAKGVYSGYCRERARARPSSRGRRLGLAGVDAGAPPPPPMSRADAGARNSEYITGRTASATSSERL
jgi:hypothetical protein